MRGSSEVRFVSLLPVFYRCRTFCASNACRAQKLEKTAVSGSKNKVRGVLGTLGRASSSVKTAKSSEKARPKCLRGLRKFISERERGHFERESATAGGPERADPRGLRREISESSNGYIYIYIYITLYNMVPLGWHHMSPNCFNYIE